VRLFPGLNHPGKKHQEHPILWGISRSFDLSIEDNQLLAKECVFCHEFGLTSGKVSHGSEQESGVGWFGPVDEAVVERLKAHACQSFDEGENRMHSVRFLF
jgi:hypothetical protein